MNHFKDLNSGKGILKDQYGQDPQGDALANKLKKKRKTMMENRGLLTDNNTQEE